MTKKVVTKVVKANGGIYYSPIGQASYQPSPSTFTPASQLSLPPGKYALTAKVRVTGANTHACRLKSGQTVQDVSSATTGPGAQATLPMLAAVNLPSGGTISIDCNATGATAGFADQVKIVAVRGPTADGPIGPLTPQ